MRNFVVFSVALGLLLSVAACEGGPPRPTPTAIPLAATATLAPRPTRPAATPTTAKATSEPTAVDETPESEAAPTPTISSLLSELDDRLAKGTVQGFLDRLVAGEAASASALFLTDEAQQGEPGRLLSELGESETQLAAATLHTFVWATDTRYEAQAELRWARGDGNGPAMQAMSLVLACQRGLWLIDDIALGNLQAVAPTPTRKPSAGASAGRQSPQLEGKLVFQVSIGGDIYVVNADGGEQSSGEQSSLGLHRLTDGLDPAWSPDGAQIALSRWREPRGVWVVDADGASGNERRVFDWSETRWPAWSPDGSKLVFSRQKGGRLDEVEKCFWRWCFTLPPNPHWKLAIVRVDDGTLLDPPSSEVSQAPTWSPDGGRLVYHDDRGLVWLDLQGDEFQQGVFAGSSGWDTSPAYSPDGKKIAFVGKAHTAWEVFVMNADGSGRKQLTFSGAEGGEQRHSVSPAWSPNGKALAFLSNRDGPWRIYVMAVSDGMDADVANQRPMFGDKLDHLGIRYEFAGERALSWGW